jgi:hypothetical protein
MKTVILNTASFACLLLAFTGCGSDAPSDSLVPVPTRDLIANGGFERPVLTDTLSSSLKPFATYATPSFAVPGWTVSAIDIVHAVLWAPFEGRQSLDLNSQAAGWIGTKVSSKAGAAYTLKFAYGTNPASTPDSPELRKFRIVWNGNPVETLSVQRVSPVAWKTESIRLTAIGNDSLRFESITAGSSAAAIDDVSLVGP